MVPGAGVVSVLVVGTERKKTLFCQVFMQFLICDTNGKNDGNQLGKNIEASSLSCRIITFLQDINLWLG